MMEKVKKIGEVVATRALTHVAVDGSRETAMVEIGRPFRDGAAGDFVCPCRISSGSFEVMFGSMGIDSLQAIEMAIRNVEAELERYLSFEGGSFEFLGESVVAVTSKEV